MESPGETNTLRKFRELDSRRRGKDESKKRRIFYNLRDFPYCYYGHISAIPWPRNQIPVTVNITNAVSSKTNTAWTASLLVAL